VKFKKALLPGGGFWDNRWREYPYPKKVCEGYTIAKYGKFFNVYYNSMRIAKELPSLRAAIKEANKKLLQSV